MTDKLCPIFSLVNVLSHDSYNAGGNCHGKACEWYDGENNCCCASTVAKYSQGIDLGLMNLDDINVSLMECRDAIQEISEPFDAHFPRRRNLTKPDC